MKNYLLITIIVICCLSNFSSCASIPQADYIHDHLDELWGKTQAEIIRLIPEEYMAAAEIKPSRIVLKHTSNLDYGYGVLIPAQNQTITYFFHNTFLYQISIESSSNEFSDNKIRQKLYAEFQGLKKHYDSILGPPDTAKDESNELTIESQEKIICGRISGRWEAKTERNTYPFLAVLLEYSCFTKPVLMIRLRETYSHSQFRP
jgi:hypothetical protein